MWIDQYLVLVLLDWTRTGQGGGNGNPAETGLIVWAAAVFDGYVATEAIIDICLNVDYAVDYRFQYNAFNNTPGRNPREEVLVRYKTACCV